MKYISKIAIIDFGSQFTQLIARRIRDLNVYSEIFCSNVDLEEIKDYKAFIFSGGPDSVNLSSDIPSIVSDIMRLNKETNIPVLGICYGLHIIARYFQSQVVSEYKKEFGKIKVRIVNNSEIINGIGDINDELDVWMSHSDSVSLVPEGFCIVAQSIINAGVAIIANEKKRIYGLQFHPEVSHTKIGSYILSNFLDIAGCERNWVVKSFLDEQYDFIKNKVGDKKVIAAVSGGVDSSVAVALLSRIIGNQLHCVFIDTGLLRKNEKKNLKDFFSDNLNISVSVIDKSSLFLDKIKLVTDSERKRKIIGETFIEVFEEEAKKIADVDFLLQGTIYPDVIESGVANSKSVKIKAHHNVGALPEIMNLTLIEPLKYLFKDEVRALGKELGLSDEVIMRHPFPGPGLAVRIIGDITKDKIKILQEVDDIYINSLKEYNLYNSIWQAFAVLLPVRTVGVMGDGRTYGYVCALRAVTSVDGMTADCFPFEGTKDDICKFWDFLQHVSNAIINNVQGVNRIVYDITSKPPSTIEWE